MFNKNDVEFISIAVPVRYEEDDIPNDFPFRKNDIWSILVKTNGEIVDFPKDIHININMKVVDTGIYILLDKDKNELARIDCYVPDNHSIPGEYGDYLDFKISNGFITNWYKNPTYEEFLRD